MRSFALLFLPTLGILGLIGCPSADQSNGTGGGSEPDAGVEVILDGGGGVEDPPKGEKACPKGACNYQTSAGCSGAAASCTPGLTGATLAPTCGPAGTGISGATCTSPSDCKPSYICVASKCRQLCCGGDWSACDSPTEHCFTPLAYQTADGTKLDSGAMVCATIDTCDALAPNTCGVAGEACQIVDPTGATACVPEGTGASGEACPCKGGYVCAANSCRRLCKAVEGGGDPLCQAGEGICVHFDRDPKGVGECTP